VIYNYALPQEQIQQVMDGIYDGGGDAVEAPALGFSMSGGDMVFDWTGSVFKVQMCTNLTDGIWADVPAGDTPPVTNSTVEPEAFFRLIEQ